MSLIARSFRTQTADSRTVQATDPEERNVFMTTRKLRTIATAVALAIGSLSAWIAYITR